MRDTIDRDEFIQLVASAEQNSSHILAQSIMAYSKENNIELLPCDSFKEVTEQGIIATIQNKKVYVGKASFAFNSEKINENLTTVYVAINEKYIGKISFSDEVRRETEETIARLKSLDVENILMLTGDNSVIANKIATEVGIDHVYSNCLPKDKINVLKNIPTELRPEIMVGDGVNDAPALSVGDVGIAMGARGSTAASESADVVILKDDLTRVTTSLEIAKQTMSIARQSVLIGIVICTILMIVASTGVLPALIGAALQEVVDVASILSALRARK